MLTQKEFHNFNKERALKEFQIDIIKENIHLFTKYIYILLKSIAFSNTKSRYMIS